MTHGRTLLNLGHSSVGGNGRAKVNWYAIRKQLMLLYIRPQLITEGYEVLIVLATHNSFIQT